MLIGHLEGHGWVVWKIWEVDEAGQRLQGRGAAADGGEEDLGEDEREGRRKIVAFKVGHYPPYRCAFQFPSSQDSPKPGLSPN